MNTHKFTGDMADQVEKDRDELIELRAVIEQCEKALELSHAIVVDRDYERMAAPAATRKVREGK